MLDHWRTRIGRIHPRVNGDVEVYDFYTAAPKNHPGVDALYIQSGTMATVGNLDQLEQAVEKPVVSSNRANLFGYFKPLGIQVGRG